MNGEIPNAPNVQKPEQTHKKGLLFEIIFVIIFLILIFSILNYFNILRLSAIFPNYLGFLPHRSYEQPQDKQINGPRQSFPIFSPSLSTEQAKQTLTSFLSTILVPSRIPSSELLLKQNKSSPNAFLTSWKTEDGIGQATFSISSKQSLSAINLSFLIEQVQTASPSVDFAKTTTAGFFSLEPKGQWGCRDILKNSAVYCENFWEEPNGIYRGIGIQSLFTSLAKKETKSIVIFCEYREKESLSYSPKSCRGEFAKTGLQ